MTISERIVSLLKQQNKQAKELAAHLGVTPGTISGWNNGSYPSSKHIVPICEFLGVSTDYLLTGSETEKAASAPDSETAQMLEKWNNLSKDEKTIIIGKMTEMNYYRTSKTTHQDNTPRQRLGNAG